MYHRENIERKGNKGKLYSTVMHNTSSQTSNHHAMQQLSLSYQIFTVWLFLLRISCDALRQLVYYFCSASFCPTFQDDGYKEYLPLRGFYSILMLRAT